MNTVTIKSAMKNQLKVVAFNGSPRPKGNTALLLQHVLEVLQKEGIETELVQVGGKKNKGCAACMRCWSKKDKRCTVKNDILNDCIEKMIKADGVLLGSPTYFADITPELKALIDRCGFVARGNDHLFRRKVGAAVIAVRRAGAIHAFDSINHFFLINQMIVPGSIYWNIGIGRQEGEVASDKEGIETMQILGENMAWLLHRIKNA